MSNYEAPRMNLLAIEADDIIQTSGTLIPGDDVGVGGSGVVIPGIPGQVSMDDTYEN